MSTVHFRSFLLLLTAVSIAFISILLPFYAAIFWGGVLAVISAPCIGVCCGSWGAAAPTWRPS